MTSNGIIIYGVQLDVEAMAEKAEVDFWTDLEELLPVGKYLIVSRSYDSNELDDYGLYTDVLEILDLKDHGNKIDLVSFTNKVQEHQALHKKNGEKDEQRTYVDYYDVDRKYTFKSVKS